MSGRYETLDGYVVRLATEKAIGIEKVRSDLIAKADVIWLPRAVCEDGDMLSVGDTDICCYRRVADDKCLDY